MTDMWLPPTYDPAPERNRGMPVCPPMDDSVVERIVSAVKGFGIPPADAEQARWNPYRRFELACLACAIWDAAEGDAAAQRILDRVRVALDNAENVGEAISAYEQPADSAELTDLMGLGD